MRRIFACLLVLALLPFSHALADFDPTTQALIDTFPGNCSFTETELAFTKEDGTVLRGTLLMPEQLDGQLPPLVILCHGFNSTRNSFAKLAYGFGKSGIASVRFDFGGSGKSDGKSTQMSVLTEVDDLNVIIDDVKALEGVNTKNLFLCGNSMGGLVSLLTAKERQHELRGLLLNYPALSLADAVRKGELLGVTFDPNQIPKVIRPSGFPVGRKFVEDIIEMDFYENLDQLTLDVLLFHGDADDTVDIAFSERAAALLPHCTYHVMEGAGHGFEGEQLVQQVEISVAFVQSHLN